MVVQTKSGKVRGVRENGMLAFKGIPFAKPPVGDLRFRPPQPVEPWGGVLDATRFGARAMQANPDGVPCSEDCLNLNIWTPEADGGLRPVVFYIHGGGHFEGSNSDGCSDGVHFVRGRQAVMVSANYRLGAFGYLHLADLLGGEYAQSGNCGLLDQIAALRWVRENIASFGGDPSRVTLMGQSAGGKSVANLMVTPQAKGLYRQAIIQSGSVQCIRDRGTAAAVARLVLRELGLREENASELLRLPAEEILRAQVRTYDSVAAWHGYGPVLDGVTITEPPEQYIAAGKVGRLPVLLGYAKEELSAPAVDPTFDESTVQQRLRVNFGLNAPHVYEKYRQHCSTMHPSIAFGRVQTEYVYANAGLALTRLLAEAGADVWSYRWDFAGRTIPHHSSEMPYLFGYTVEQNPNGYYPEFAWMDGVLNGAWLNFVLHGTPQTPDLPQWPVCAPADARRMHFDTVNHVEPLDLDGYDQEFPMQAIRL